MPNERFVTDKLGLSNHSLREAIFIVINLLLLLLLLLLEVRKLSSRRWNRQIQAPFREHFQPPRRLKCSKSSSVGLFVCLVIPMVKLSKQMFTNDKLNYCARLRFHLTKQSAAEAEAEADATTSSSPVTTKTTTTDDAASRQIDKHRLKRT